MDAWKTLTDKLTDEEIYILEIAHNFVIKALNCSPVGSMEEKESREWLDGANKYLYRQVRKAFEEDRKKYYGYEG